MTSTPSRACEDRRMVAAQDSSVAARPARVMLSFRLSQTHLVNVMRCALPALRSGLRVEVGDEDVGSEDKRHWVCRSFVSCHWPAAQTDLATHRVAKEFVQSPTAPSVTITFARVASQSVASQSDFIAFSPPHRLLNMEPSTEYTGKFQMTDSENFDAFMGALGIGYLTRCSITFRQTFPQSFCSGCFS